MSGWIRVKELPTRYEVRTKHWVERYNVMTHAVAEHSKRQYWEQSAKLVTIRRWQVKRTDVTESCLVSYTDYITRNNQTIVMLSKYTFGWCMSIPVGTNSSIYPTREAAEAAARKWLRDNGYRIAKVAT